MTVMTVTSFRALLAGALALTMAPPRHRPDVAPTSSDAVFVGVVRTADRGIVLPNVQIVAYTAAASTVTDAAGRYVLRVPNATRGTVVTLLARRVGYATRSAQVRVTGDTTRADFVLATVPAELAGVIVTGTGQVTRDAARAAGASEAASVVAPSPSITAMRIPTFLPNATPKMSTMERRDRRDRRAPVDREPYNREQYDRIEDNPFLAVASNPMSTFSVDVDRASYGNVRRFLLSGQRPPADAARIEELVNYFPYELPSPRGDDPVAITTEVAPAPWRPEHRLVRIALQSRRIETAALPPSNLVFLIDVSGSMNEPNKLPLVKRSLQLLVDQLREQDRVAIVVYAGRAGLVLPSTSGADKARIAEAIDRLEAGGSTAGGDGLLLAYRVAREHRVPNGMNRVILATDGDFNVGVSSDGELERLIEAKRAEGTYLTVLGFGTGNYQDAKMEKLAKRGNGNYAYVDDLSEARKVLVHEMGATLHTVADDVKLQVEFNPAAVRGYRLLGYEDRLLRDEDFADDTKDAGDMGAGHVVTALYEVVPAGVTNTVELRGTEPRRYDRASGSDTPEVRSGRGELLFVKLRYKKPGESTSRLLTQPVANDAARRPSDDFRFAASVAEFGMLLRDSEHKGRSNTDQVLDLARGALGSDEGGYRSEFVRLVETYRTIARPTASRDR